MGGTMKLLGEKSYQMNLSKGNILDKNRRIDQVAHSGRNNDHNNLFFFQEMGLREASTKATTWGGNHFIQQ